MSKSFVLVSVFALAAGAALAAQHLPVAAQHTTPANHFAAMHQHLLSACSAESDSATATQSHLPQHLVDKLALTPAQVAQIDRLATEGCATMRRIHRDISGVLTAEQHAAMAKMHGGTSHGALVEWFKKLHGGK